MMLYCWEALFLQFAIRYYQLFISLVGRLDSVPQKIVEIFLVRDQIADSQYMSMTSCQDNMQKNPRSREKMSKELGKHYQNQDWSIHSR